MRTDGSDTGIEPDIRRRQWLVKGRVQGVGFRAAARKAALEHDLVGVVRNLDDGNVQVIAMGKARCLDHLGRWLKSGPMHARVGTVEPGQPDDDALDWDSLSGFRIE